MTAVHSASYTELFGTPRYKGISSSREISATLGAPSPLVVQGGGTG